METVHKSHTEALKQDPYEPLFLNAHLTDELLERRKKWAALEEEYAQVRVNVESLHNLDVN